MKRNCSKNRQSSDDELLPEYIFDYHKAKPNRFAGRVEVKKVVSLDADVAVGK
ncbi:MAG: hypothetical protein LH649_13370 [Pseudanabaena sp. CAN_BIN31]|nr:hypothetical protein [Pseudanabaena sp. CAN_BIN31]